MTFAKRVNELGYEVRRGDDSNLQKALEIVRSDRSDIKKMEKLKVNTLDTGDKPDIFDGLFKDHSIDIHTGALLGRYICEERDTARLLRSCYDQLVAADKAGGAAPASESLTALESKVDALCGAVEELREIVCAQTVSTNGRPANGRKAARATAS